ncbi:hypothetical protein ACOMHN_036832 [Nucella lapillus]
MTSAKTMTLHLSLMVAVLVTSPAVCFRRGSGRRDVIRFHQDRGTQHSLQTMFKLPHPDRGYLANCGPQGGYFNISWFPKEVSPMNKIEIFAQVVLPVDMDRVHIEGELMYDGTRMLVINRDYSCEDMAEKLSFMFQRDALRLKCPIRKGQLLSGYFLYTDTETLMGDDGNYHLKLNVYDMSGHELVCIDAKLTILPFPDS